MHRSVGMRSAWFFWVLALGLLAYPAHAQQPPPPCTSATLGLNFSMTLAVRRGNEYLDLQSGSLSNIINLPECLCDTNDNSDLYVQITISQAITRSGTQPNFEVWVGGSNCENVMNRTANSTTCEQVLSPDINISNFYPGGASGPIFQRIPVRALISPRTRSCGAGSASNLVWFIFGNPSSPDATCSLSLPSQTRPPDPPEMVTTASGDRAVTVNWVAPQQGPNQPASYQVLCATADGQPVPRNRTHEQIYSTCTPSGIDRRDNLPYVDPVGGGGGMDGGVDGGDGGVADGGSANVDAGTVPDGGAGGMYTVGAPPFNYLDPRFLCSDRIDGVAREARIDGLTNGQTYQFLVVGVDVYGNPSPSPVIMGQAQAVEDLYNRFLNQGGKPQGFCFIATAAYGSYESPYVKVLRRFRDEVLMPRASGRAFVDWYYQRSPGAAAYISERPAVRWLVRLALWPVIGMAAVWLWMGPGGIVLLAAAFAGGVYRWRRGRMALAGRVG